MSSRGPVPSIVNASRLARDGPVQQRPGSNNVPMPCGALHAGKDGRAESSVLRTQSESALALHALDNAQDARAKHVEIEHVVLQGHAALRITDSGSAGLDESGLRKMLSFGYSHKPVDGGYQPIGMYGNGFKSGAMRLGKDAIIISKSKSGYALGFLSQTFHEEERLEEYVVPMIFFDLQQKLIMRDDTPKNLEIICKYAPFSNAAELQAALPHRYAKDKDVFGTRIFIYNLKMIDGRCELDFETDPTDIRLHSLPQERRGRRGKQRPNAVVLDPNISLHYSLRAYCEFLYLDPKLIITIRGATVHSELIKEILRHPRTDHYRPNNSSSNPVRLRNYPITWGLNDSKTNFGLMLYHRGRLIMAYHRVGIQTQAQAQAVGVVGVVEADFLQPAHNKQGFTEENFQNAMKALSDKLRNYWKWVEPKVDKPYEQINWVRCDKCGKWRIMPNNMTKKDLPQRWDCTMNTWNEDRASCNVPQDKEPEARRKRKGDMAEVRKAQRQIIAKQEKALEAPASPAASTSDEESGYSEFEHHHEQLQEQPFQQQEDDEDADLNEPVDSFLAKERLRALDATQDQQPASVSVTEKPSSAREDDGIDNEEQTWVDQCTQLDDEGPTHLDTVHPQPPAEEEAQPIVKDETDAADMDVADDIQLEFFEEDQLMVEADVPQPQPQLLSEPEDEPQRSQQKRKSSAMDTDQYFARYTAQFTAPSKRRKLGEQTRTNKPTHKNDHAKAEEPTLEDEHAETEAHKQIEHNAPAPRVRSKAARQRSRRVILDEEEEEQEAELDAAAMAELVPELSKRFHKLFKAVSEVTNSLRQMKGQSAHRTQMPTETDIRTIAMLDVDSLIERFQEAAK